MQTGSQSVGQWHYLLLQNIWQNHIFPCHLSHVKIWNGHFPCHDFLASPEKWSHMCRTVCQWTKNRTQAAYILSSFASRTTAIEMNKNANGWVSGIKALHSCFSQKGSVWFEVTFWKLKSKEPWNTQAVVDLYSLAVRPVGLFFYMIYQYICHQHVVFIWLYCLRKINC